MMTPDVVKKRFDEVDEILDKLQTVCREYNCALTINSREGCINVINETATLAKVLLISPSRQMYAPQFEEES